MRSPTAGLALIGAVLAWPASGQTLQQFAKQQGCTSNPVVVDGTDLYKCQTQSGMSYFSGPAAGQSSTGKKAVGSASKAPTPANFPRVDNATQRERDDVRKRVLREELATEVRLQGESENILKQGSTPLPDETVTSPKYIDRVARLRQTVDNHTKNVQALNRELERIR